MVQPSENDEASGLSIQLADYVELLSEICTGEQHIASYGDVGNVEILDVALAINSEVTYHMGAAVYANAAVEYASLGSATSDESSAVRTYRVYSGSAFTLPQNANAAASVRTHHPRANVALGETLDAVVGLAKASDAHSGRIGSQNARMIKMLAEALHRVVRFAYAFDAHSRHGIDPDDASASGALGESLDAVVIRIAGVSADAGYSEPIRCADN